MKCVICIAFLIVHLSLAQDECESHQMCPTWFIPNTTSNESICKCGSSLSGAVHCGDQSNLTSLLYKYCMTYSCEHNSTYVGRCPFNSHHGPNTTQAYVELPAKVSEINDFMCGKFNRTGLLCSRCSDGLGVATLSYEPYCLECWNSLRGWALYFFLILFPPTLFFFAIILIQVKMTSAEMNYFVFISQLISIDVNQFESDVKYDRRGPTSLLITFYGFWNLDFFRYVIPRFCVSNTLSQIHVLALDYIPALYPLLLIVLTYVSIELHDRDCRVLVWLWRPFGRCFSQVRILRRLNPKASVLNAFASFWLLSYTKLLFVSCSLLGFTTVHNDTGDQSGPRRVYHNATIPYLSSEHIPFFTLAIFVLVIFIAPFTLLLILYPMRWFQRCIGCTGWACHALHTFADVFHGCYKNGTNGTRDYRYFAGLYFIFRIALIVVVIYGRYALIIGSLVSGVSSLMFVFLRPYRNNRFNILDCLASALLALAHQILLYNQYNIFRVSKEIIIVFIMLPFLYFFAYSAYKLAVYSGVFYRCHRIFRYLKLRISRHTLTDTDDIQWGLPDRLENPSHYTNLSNPASENNQLQTGVCKVSTYGSIQ